MVTITWDDIITTDVVAEGDTLISFAFLKTKYYDLWL
jgi:hypothetical protein